MQNSVLVNRNPAFNNINDYRQMKMVHNNPGRDKKSPSGFLRLIQVKFIQNNFSILNLEALL